MLPLYTPPHVFFRGISDRALVPAAVLLLSAALILSSCANAVNSRGGAVGSGGGGGGSSSSAASASAAASQSGSSGTAPDIVVGADSGSYTVASDGHVDYYSDVLGSGSASSKGNYGYVVISPLPSGTLYTDYTANTPVSWSSYTVKVFVDGTEAVSHSFAAGDTEAYVLENVPVGSTLRAQAVIAVSGSSLGYTQLQAESGTQQMASGSNTITMWVEYPLECRIASAFTGSGGAPESISGYSSTVTSYSNAAATALTAPPESYTDGGLPYTFVGWSKEDWDGTGTAPEPVLTSRTTIPAGTFKGRVTLYAVYETLDEVTVRYELNLPDGVYPAASGFKLVDSVTGAEDADGEVEVDIPDLLSASPSTAILVPKYAGYIITVGTEDKAYVFKGWKYDSTATSAQILCTPNPAALPGSSPFSPQYYIPAMLAYRDSDDNTVTLTAVWEAVDTTNAAEEKAVWRNVSYTVPYYNSHSTFKLCTAEQVKALFDVQTGIIGRQGKDFDGKTITLLDNINVGSMTTSLTSNWISFKGTLDGNGKTLTASIYGASNTGLFYALAGGTVKNLTLAGSVTGSSDWTGGIAGNIYVGGGTIEDCTVTADVTGSGSGSDPDSRVYVGGIAGKANGGTIRRCTASGTVSSSADDAKVGGIVGYAGGVTVTGNTFNGTVTYSGSTATGFAGGIVGFRNVGDVSGNTMSGTVNAGSGSQNSLGY